MNRRRPVLEPGDVYPAGHQIDLIPAKGYEFRNSQTMTVAEQDQRRVPVSVPADVPGCLHQHLYLVRRQVFARADF
jgi:hypothetical protein